ncbi:MAG: PAS domain-containing protein [Xanthobacteraceae bacterium]
MNGSITHSNQVMALAASPELRLIYDTAPIGLAFLTPDCRYALINQHLTEICGISVADHIGRSVRECVPKVADQVEHLVRAILQSGEPVTGVEINGQRPDGSNTDQVWITYWHPLKNQSGDILGINVAAEEITERKRAEQALAASQDSLRKLNDTLAERVEAQAKERDRIWNVSQDLLTVTDLDGVILDVNPAWLSTLGWASDELIGNKIEQFVSSADRDRSYEEFRRLLAGGRPQHFENRISCKDGSLRWLAWRAVLDRGQVYAVGRDVTNIRQTQEELHKLQRTLAYVSRDSTMGIMTASLAHEIRQPLAVIVASASAGLRWLNRAEPDLTEAQQSLAAIAKEGQRIADIISSIRAMFSKEEPDSVPLDVGRLVVDILALAQGELHSKNVSLRNKLPSRLPLVIGKRVQLQQVLLNLIMNAIEAMSSVNGRERELTILAGQTNDQNLEVIVEDTGCGIDPVDYERIFNTFFTTKQHGMGMGLFICRSIIEAHGGSLWALPRSPFGTAFHLTLPLDLQAEK